MSFLEQNLEKKYFKPFEYSINFCFSGPSPTKIILIGKLINKRAASIITLSALASPWAPV